MLTIEVAFHLPLMLWNKARSAALLFNQSFSQQQKLKRCLFFQKKLIDNLYLINQFLYNYKKSLMAEKPTTNTKKSFSFDWLIQGVLTRLGDIFDTFTGRRWKPSSSLATSELTEKLKFLLDSKVQESENKGKFVPHNIQLKMQWDKFSTGENVSLKKLENELLIAAVDHINDHRYHTYAPLNLEIKPDYFTEGVKLSASFGTDDESDSAAAINVTVPDLKNVVIAPEEEIAPEVEGEIYIAKFTVKGKERETKLSFGEKMRRTIGRSGENDLWLDDESVSKIHAALIINGDGHLVMSDTGSTNGTFINDQRIAYGKAIPVNAGDKVKFGTIEVELSRVEKETDFEVEEEVSEVETPKMILPKTIEGSKHLPIAQSIIIKPEPTAAKTEVLLKEDLKLPENTGAENDVPDETPLVEETTDEKQKNHETSVDKANSDAPNFETEQGIDFDFDLDEK